jgi:hypothetical protein
VCERSAVTFAQTSEFVCKRKTVHFAQIELYANAFLFTVNLSVLEGTQNETVNGAACKSRLKLLR